MATPLPPNPNLQHLKKQAKALLRAFRLNEIGVAAKFEALHLKRAPKLSDAQQLIARDYGFTGWSSLKEHVESLSSLNEDVLQAAKTAFHNDDASTLSRLFDRYPGLKARIDEPVGAFDAPLINLVRSREMLDVLLDAGADINARSRWWAGGFGLLECASPDVAEHAITRGADVTVHAAARLGMLGELKELVAADPTLVHARGGDGQTPLHFASNVDVAEFLLDRGADIDARDIDHESTPAQYMVRSRQDVVRFLIRRGCETDVLMAAAIGDIELIRSKLDADPDAIRMRVSDEYFPMIDSGKGGTIYQWELGWHVSACQVARSFGYTELFHFLMKRCPADEKLLNACWIHDEGLVKSLLDRYPDLVEALPAAGRRQLAHAARNNDTSAARLMLAAGLPVAGTFGQHHATALHWAAWHGNVQLVRHILRRDPPLEDADNDFKSTPLGWAIHGSENAWEHKKGEYPATVEQLLDAGAKPPRELQGTEAVREVLRQRGVG